MARIPGRFDRDFSVRLAVFAFTAFFLFYCMARHVPWRDEYQTFLVATRTKSWAEFWTATRYERTPPFHYLLQRALWPLANGALDPRTFIRAITIPFTLLNAYLILFRFRFPVWLAALLVLNVFFFREWGMISRSYVIGGALVLLSVDLRNRGRANLARISLALSAATHLLFFVSAGVWIAFDLVSEWRRSATKREGAFFGSGAFAIAVLAIVTVHSVPPSDSAFVTGPHWPGLGRAIGHGLSAFALAFFPLEGHWTSEGYAWAWNENEVRFAWAIFFAVPLFFAFRRRRDLLFRFGFAAAPILAVFVFVYGPALRHVGALYVFFVAVLAERYFRDTSDGAAPSRSERFAPSLLVVGPFLVTLVWISAWRPWHPRFRLSDSPSLAPLVREAGRTFTSRDYLLFPAMAESGREVYDVSRDRIAAYPDFRGVVPELSAEEFCRRNGKWTLRSGDLYVVGTAYEGGADGVFGAACGRWEKVYQTEGRVVTDERFAVYRYLGATPENRD
ncbi:MAG: hypothetical protein JST04_12935 [Bdellovibrionales bacterium]|nr:hypothetical protein [Bdellovibrionales bacterium]